MKQKFSIVQLNDMHAYLEPHLEVFYNSEGVLLEEVGGFARIKTVIESIQKEGPTFVFDNGDTLHGTHEAINTNGEILVPLLNELGLSAMTFHWDIAYGPKQLRKIGTQLNYPILAINAYNKETDELAFEPYAIVEKDSIRIGVIGIAATIVDKTMPAPFSEGLRFTLGREELPKFVKELKAKEADLIVVLSHLGFPQDYKLMSEVEGIDLCLSGHTHHRLTKPVRVNDTVIIQSGQHGSFVGRIDVSLPNKEVNHSLIVLNNEISEHPQMKEMVEDAIKPYEEHLKKVIGQTDGILHRGTNLESTMDNLLLESILDHTQSELVFSNGWRYGAPIDKGPITLKQLTSIIPMNPPISTVQITGQEIVDMLEENLENTYSSEPYHQMGGYLKRALGCKVYFKVENPKGQRIQQLFIGNELVDLEKVYSASYVTNQGIPKKYGHHHHDLDVHAQEAMMKYLEKIKIYHAQYFEPFVMI